MLLQLLAPTNFYPAGRRTCKKKVKMRKAQKIPDSKGLKVLHDVVRTMCSDKVSYGGGRIRAHLMVFDASLMAFGVEGLNLLVSPFPFPFSLCVEHMSTGPGDTSLFDGF